MSTQSLRELVEAIKSQGTTLANATGATAASARDLVYLSTSVERLFGADAILELIDTAARPVEHRQIELANTQAETLTVDQITKTVIRYSNTSNTHTATEFVVTVPNRGVAFVIDNELPVPLKVKTSAQTAGQGIPEIGAGKVGWVFCDGDTVQHVIDTDAITSALTSPTQDPGDMIYRAGVPTSATQDFYVFVRNYGGDMQFYIKPKAGDLYPKSYEERTPNITLYPGVTYRFYQEDGSNDGTVFKFSTTIDGTHNATPGVELLDLDSSGSADITYVGTPGTDGAYTQVVMPALGTSMPASIYYYNSAAAGYGGNSVTSINSDTGVTKLPIGRANEILAVSRQGDRPEWRNYNWMSNRQYAVAPRDEFTGLWSEGKYRMANHLTDTTKWPYLANKGTYDAQQPMQMAYRGSMMLFAQGGRITGGVWGSNTEGRNNHSGVVETVYKGLTFSSVNNQNGEYGMDVVEREQMKDHDIKFTTGNYASTCFVTSNGYVYMCGHGDEGQIGNAQNSDQTPLHRVRFPSDAGPVRYVQNCGRDTTNSFIALMEDGDLYAWGYNGYGQLGVGDTTNRNVPVKISAFDKNVRSLVAGGGNYGTYIAITNDDTAYAWGYNGYGQCGNGNTTDQYTPVQINISGNPAIAKAQVNGNSSHTSCHLLLGNGRVYGFGRNNHGQVGDGSTSDRNTPTLVSGLGLEANKYVIDIWGAMGGYEGGTFYLTDNGDMYYSGYNSRGQGGVGNANGDITVPTMMAGDIKWVSQICSPCATDSTSYRYNQCLFLSHENEQDRRDRINGTVRTTGYTGDFMGKGNRPTNEVEARPVLGQFQGNVRWIMTGGYHWSSTLETSAYCIDHEGGFWGWGYNGEYATPGYSSSNWHPSLLD